MTDEEKIKQLQEQVRKLERSAKWLPDQGEPLSIEHFHGIRMRWSTGPERYQADADALIGCVIMQRRMINFLIHHCGGGEELKKEFGAESQFKLTTGFLLGNGTGMIRLEEDLDIPRPSTVPPEIHAKLDEIRKGLEEDAKYESDLPLYGNACVLLRMVEELLGLQPDEGGE